MYAYESWFSSSHGNKLHPKPCVTNWGGSLRNYSKRARRAHKKIKPSWLGTVLALPILACSSKPKFSHLLRTTDCIYFPLTPDDGPLLFAILYQVQFTFPVLLLLTPKDNNFEQVCPSILHLSVAGQVTFLSSEYWSPFIFSWAKWIFTVHSYAQKFIPRAGCLY